MGFTPDTPLKSFLAKLVFQWYKTRNLGSKGTLGTFVTFERDSLNKHKKCDDPKDIASR